MICVDYLDAVFDCYFGCVVVDCDVDGGCGL